MPKTKTARRSRSATARAAAAATKVIRDGRRARTPKAAPRPPANPGSATPTKAEQAATDKKARQEKIRADVKRKLARLTEMSKTTAEQCGRLVEAWDEAAAKVEDLKPHLEHAKAELQKTKESIRQQVRAMKSAGQSKDDLADQGKELAGMEGRAEKWELSILQLTEQRDGHREAAKAAMADLRQLIRDKVAGGLLFERDDEQRSSVHQGAVPASALKVGHQYAMRGPKDPRERSCVSRVLSVKDDQVEVEVLSLHGAGWKLDVGTKLSMDPSKAGYSWEDLGPAIVTIWRGRALTESIAFPITVTDATRQALIGSGCKTLGDVADRMMAGKLGDTKGLTPEQFVAVSNAMEQLAGEKAVA